MSEGAPDKGKRPISTYRSDYYNNSEDYDNNKYSRRGRNSEDEADDERDRQMQPPVQFVKYTAEDAPTLSGSEIAMFQEITGESQDEAEKYLKVFLQYLVSLLTLCSMLTGILKELFSCIMNTLMLLPEARIMNRNIIVITTAQ